MIPVACWTLNLKTVSESNCSEHWTKKSKRHKQQQFFIRTSFNKEVKNLQLPCKITLTRLANRKLDDDNLVSAFKWIRDQLADCIVPGKAKGHADSDPRIKWSIRKNKVL
jgi:hypothetical protein